MHIMIATGKHALRAVATGTFLLCALPARLQAWEPNARDLDEAIKTDSFAGYLTEVGDWLNRKVPAAPEEKALATLLQDPVFSTVLDQRQILAKTGVEGLKAFAGADPAHRAFLAWLLRNKQAMDLYLEGAVPIALAAREQNTYALPVAALEIWKNIHEADPESRDGLCLRLAIATALYPPGSVNIGAGGAAKPADPVARYHYFKAAHKNGELFPSFDHLTVWEYGKIVSSGASDDDLTWARNMLNTWRPDLRIKEQVVRSTSMVWRRTSPIPYDNSFKNVLAGGGKCGPRSSWSVMICQAFGIPAVGVGQPGHACVAYKACDPSLEPQPGHLWKVDYGRGWEVSKIAGLPGNDFLAGVEDRAHEDAFSRVEHLRWLAAALVRPEQAAAVMATAHSIQQSAAEKPQATASTKTGAPGDKAATANATDRTPIREAGGVIHVDAADFARTGGTISWGGQVPHVLVHDCFTGGKQVYFQQQMKSQWADYILDVPATRTYRLTMKAAVVNEDQLLEVLAADNVIATVRIPQSYGLWRETTPVELKLEQGTQTLRVQTPTSVKDENFKRGIALRSFDLKAK